MKTRIAFVLIALLVAGTAGITWAAQPADQPSADTAVEAPEQGAELTPAEIDGLFIEPEETYDCSCRVNCFAEYDACLSACPDNDLECVEACGNARSSCVNGCF